MDALKKICMTIMAILMFTGCAATVPEVQYLTCKDKLSELQPSHVELRYLKQLEQETPALNAFLNDWALDFASFLSNTMKVKIEIHIEEYVFLDNFNEAIIRSWAREPNVLRKAITIMAKNDNGVWEYVHTVWSEAIPLKFSPTPEPEENTDEEL